MDPERWREIERIFNQALDRSPAERDALLLRECHADADLESSVRQLLNRMTSPAGLLDEPVLDVARQMFPASEPLLTDLRVGVYLVQTQLGSGGMGVVYRALDTKLNRPVAIKFLSDDLAGAPIRHRFEREARTASALNHPHIVTVHDTGEFEGRPYLVTELVDGGTLRNWVNVQHGWRETIELLVGVADALAAAHDAGVLHRDVKPENILITKSGYAKLGDFGLAKLWVRAAADDATATRTETRTQSGVIAGTVAYMSPEQASGRRLDARSDIFSFGVVLYEALAGQRPFAGASTPDLLHAIVYQPAPLLAESIPSALRTLLDKALQKDPGERFQSMRELVAELRELLRHGAETPPKTVLPHTAASARSSRALRWSIAAAALVVVMVAVATWAGFRRWQTEPVRRDYTQLTNFADSAVSPALSRDGRMLAFIRGESAFGGALGQLYVKLLPDGEPVQLTHDERIKSFPKFSADGAWIAYTTAEGPAGTLDTWVVPVLGGEPRPFLTNASGLTWISNRTATEANPFLLFSEFTGRGFQMSIATSTASRTAHRTVYKPSETGMAHRSHLSPDRTQVLVVEMDAGTWLPCRVAPFDASSAGKPVGPAPAQCTDAAWSPDGRWMYFSTNNGTGIHIWRQRFPDGVPEQVTFGVTEEEGIEFDPDGRSFVTSVGNRQSTIWYHDPGGDRQITSEGFAFFPNISPDGTKLYYLVRGGGPGGFLSGSLWVVDLGSGLRRQLLPDFHMSHYNVSTDGRRVVFGAVDREGRAPLWLASLDGSAPPRQLTSISSYVAYFGQAGDVIFESAEKARAFIYRIKEDGSGLQPVSSTPALLPFAVSPDGRWIPAAEGPAPETRDLLALYPLSGGPAQTVCRCYPPPNIDNGPMPPQMSWTADGKFLYLKFATSTYAIPLQPGQVLPPIPPGGFASRDAVAAVPGATLVSEGSVFPGPNPSVYAFMKVATQRNIYRVPVR